MPAGKRPARPARRAASPDKPRERARRALAMVELLTRGVHRLKMEAAQLRSALRARMASDAFEALDWALGQERDKLYPLTDAERAIAEIPW